MMPIARILRPLAAAALLAAALPASAQPGTDDQLAREYMRQGEYEKALLYLEKIYDKQPTAYWYEQLIKAQSALGRYDEAEKLAKERMRRQGDDPVFLVDIGALRLMQGDTAKGRQQFDKALKALRPDQAAVRNLANAFSKYDQLGLALETYERGRRLIKDGASDFFYETAALRAAQGDVPGMMSDYLDLLTVNPAYMQAVQNGLGRFIDFTAQDSRSEGLRTELLRRIQKEPDNTLFQEMLIWLYIQRKDLNAGLRAEQGHGQTLQGGRGAHHGPGRHGRDQQGLGRGRQMLRLRGRTGCRQPLVRRSTHQPGNGHGCPRARYGRPAAGPTGRTAGAIRKHLGRAGP
jgi:tetratricopeptide (TPR) repeat protein